MNYQVSSQLSYAQLNPYQDSAINRMIRSQSQLNSFVTIEISVACILTLIKSMMITHYY